MTKAAIARGLCGLVVMPSLLGCHFFGFAFVPHEFQFALGFFEGGRDFLLHAGGGLFEFLRELDVAVVLHASGILLKWATHLHGARCTKADGCGFSL